MKMNLFWAEYEQIVDVYMYALNFSDSFGFISVCQYFSIYSLMWGLLDLSKLLVEKTPLNSRMEILVQFISYVLK